MGDLLIRNLPDATLVDLQRRAQFNRTSPEEEARRLLEQRAPAQETPFDLAAWIEQARALRAKTGLLPGPSSTELLRADRDRDNLS